MARSEFTVTTPMSPGDAFDLLVDLTRVSEWDRGIRDAHQLTGDGHVAGSTYEVTVKGFDGQPTQVVYELLSVDRPDGSGSGRFVMEGVNDVFRAHDTLDFEPADTGTGCSVRYVAELELLGPQPPLKEAELDAVFDRLVGVAADGLRAHLGT